MVRKIPKDKNTEGQDWEEAMLVYDENAVCSLWFCYA